MPASWRTPRVSTRSNWPGSVSSAAPSGPSSPAAATRALSCRAVVRSRIGASTLSVADVASTTVSAPRITFSSRRCGRRTNPATHLTEFVTGYPALLARRFPLTTGSEYLGPEHGPGQLVAGVPHEDLQALSFEDGSLDVILSLDVIEHVPDERMAFSEMARCLRPGGTLLVTAPTRIDHDDNAIRAVMSASGEVTHILEPEYHGNPIDPEAGSLCYRYFGWQVLSQLKEAGFRDAQLLTYWSRRFRYYGDPQLAILALR